MPVRVAASFDGDLVLFPVDQVNEASELLRRAGHRVIGRPNRGRQDDRIKAACKRARSANAFRSRGVAPRARTGVAAAWSSGSALTYAFTR